MLRCPICDRPLSSKPSSAGVDSAPTEGNRAFPFCSSRCRLIDLGKWMNEDYRVPVDEPSNEEDADGFPTSHHPLLQE